MALIPRIVFLTFTRTIAASLGLAMACVLFPLHAGAQDGGEAPSPEQQAQELSAEQKAAIAQLERVRSDIKREEERLQSLRTRQKEIESELKNAEREYSAAANAKEKVAADLTKVEAETGQVAASIAETKQEIAAISGRLDRRIVAIYKTRRRTSSLDYLFNATSATDFLKRAYYLSLISGQDRHQLNLLAEELKKLSESETRMGALKETKTAKLAETAELEKKLEAKKLEKANLLREETEKQKLSAKALDKLRDSALHIESMIAGMTGSEDKPKLPEARPETKPETKPETRPDEPKPEVPGQVAVVSAVARTAKALVTVAPFQGEGLSRLKGDLQFPVHGRIVQHFGRQQHDEFADILFIKGLEVKGQPTEEVRAIASGKVMFSNVLPGYGNVVIIDHGARYYSLYGRLGAISARIGETVQAGDTVGVLGKPDAKGRNFYFELRVQGKATDPAKYFKALPPEERS